MIRKFLFFLSLIFLPILAAKGIYEWKDGFSPRRIHPLFYPADSDWGPEIGLILEQPFRYIGRGRQCFAFESEDGQYVLKLPRTDIYQVPFWLKALPFEAIRNRVGKEAKEREKFILESFQISKEELKEQTGLIAVHLGQSPPQGKKLILSDASGYRHRLALDKTPFLLQSKQPLLMKQFQKALRARNQIEAEKILKALFTAVAERAAKGILNRDRSFLRNYGYDGKRAYQIDIGSFFRKPDLDLPRAYEKSIRDSMDPIEEWLCEKAPEMLDFFYGELDAFLAKKRTLDESPLGDEPPSSSHFFGFSLTESDPPP